MSAYITMLIRDYGKEKSTLTIPIEVQAGATTVTEIQSFATSLEAAINPLSLGKIVKVTFSQDLSQYTDEPATDPAARRELAARFFVQDTINFKKGHVSVACPDLANLDVDADGDTLVLTDAEAAAVVSWLETNMQLTDGNAVQVDRAVIVGRNN